MFNNTDIDLKGVVAPQTAECLGNSSSYMRKKTQ